MPVAASSGHKGPLGPVVEEAAASRRGAALGGGLEALGSCFPPLAGALERAQKRLLACACASALAWIRKD